MSICLSPDGRGSQRRRRVEMERRLQEDTMLSDSRRNRHLQQLGKKESTFLRLKRTKIGLNDFKTVKVIGKGAFGEVSLSSLPGFRCVNGHVRQGPIGPERRYGQNIRDEVVEEDRDVEEGSGGSVSFTCSGVITDHYWIACACSSRERCSRRIRYALDCATLLFFPRSHIPIPRHGIPSRR